MFCWEGAQTAAASTNEQHQILDNLPKDAHSRSISLSNKPAGGEERLLSSLKGVPIERVGLRYVSYSEQAQVGS